MKSITFVAVFEKEWWKKWQKTVMPTLLSAKKWKFAKENLIVEDVVLLTLSGKVKTSHTIAIMFAVHPDKNDLVKCGTVKFMSHDVKEKPEVCKAVMEEKEVAVQRLLLLVPATRPTQTIAQLVSSAQTTSYVQPSSSA